MCDANAGWMGKNIWLKFLFARLWRRQQILYVAFPGWCWNCLVKVNQARMCIENFNICVSENLVEWLIFQLKLKISEVSITKLKCVSHNVLVDVEITWA